MKKISIFIASSLVEFALERMQLELFIRNVSDRFEDVYNVKLQPILCENLDDVYTNGRKQEEYNQRIRESELCFFIFFTKAGRYTREEFDVARKQFEQTGSPKIYTYFKIIEEGEGEEELYKFMHDLDRVFGHYYGTFSHIDTLKLRIMLSLKLREMEFLEVRTEGGHCVVDGREVMKLDHVSEFANNRDLAELQSELTEVQKTYIELSKRYDELTDEEYKKYCAVAAKRRNLSDEIEELQAAIFKLSTRMANDINGEIYEEQLKAYRLLESGDYEGALAILNSKDIEDELLRELKISEEKEAQATKRRINAQIKYIRFHATSAEILYTMKKYEGRFEEIERHYELILPHIFKSGVELDTAYAYVYYLVGQKKESKALPIAEKLLDMYDADDDKTKLINALGVICYNLDIPEKAEEYYKKAIELYEKLVVANPDRFEPDLALSYNNIGVFYKNRGNTDNADEYYRKAIELREKLAGENPDRYNPDLAESYNNAGNLCQHQGNPGKAEEYYKKVIGLYEKLAEKNPDGFDHYLAMSYHNVSVFYKKQGNPGKVEECYRVARGIFEKLAKDNPDRFTPELATHYNDSGDFYKYNRQPDKAEEYYKKAIELREKLAKKDPDRFNPHLAESYNNAGVFYAERQKPDRAQEYLVKAIELREKLAAEKPDRYDPDLAMSYNNAGLFYATNYGCSDEAEVYYQKAIELYEKLAWEYPERFIPHLAGSNFNYALLKNDDFFFIKALALAQASPDHPMCKNIIEALS